jgi:long-chain acyl-CoA synthetase
MLLSMKSRTVPQFISEQHFFDFLYHEFHHNGKLMPLGRILYRSMTLFPDEEALIFKDTTVTYKELYYRSALLSKKLHAQGIRPHDKVVLLFENSIEFYIGYYAIAQLGAVVVPLNIFLHDKEFLYIIGNATPAGIIASQEFVQKLRTIKELSLPIIFTEQDMDLSSIVPPAMPEVPFFDLAPDDMAVLLYTSGTTGMPKGVMLSSKNCIMNVIQAVARIGIGLDPNERLFGVLPLFHSFAQNTCVWAALLMGATVILVPRIERRAIVDGLKHNPTIFLGIPALYGLLCLLKTAPIEQVKYFVCGGDALPDKIRTGFALLYRRKIINGYGLTETAPVIAVELADQTLPGSTVGKPLIGVDVQLRDEENAVITQQGAVGHLWVKGDNVMLGYYKAEEMTAQTIQDGWLATGDLAYFDSEGRLVIAGRIKDLIIHKGFNIYPQEIENVLLLHPLVIRAAVIGKEDLDVGEIPIAFVQLKAEDEFIEKQLKELCAQNLASYKIPRHFIWSVDPLPTTATGKVDKKKLKTQL